MTTITNFDGIYGDGTNAKVDAFYANIALVQFFTIARENQQSF